MSPTHVIVDGSNLATEGRTLPSLEQLEAAVAAYEDENPDAEIIVVVDATFEHRIEESERGRLKEAKLHGEVVSPPAGTVGRGDAFVLKIAERTGGIVLSNDSFQEFHGDHPWLFDEGRLVGGKPVTGVGWIFTPRTPVRGPKSRAATQAASKRRGKSAPPAKKLAVTRPDGSKPKVGDTLVPVPPPPPAPRAKVRAYELAKELEMTNKELLALAKKAKVAVASHSSSIAPEDADALREAAGAARASVKVRAYELARELEMTNKELLALAASAGVAVASHSSSLSAAEADTLRAVQAKATRAKAVVEEATGALDSPGEATNGPSRRSRRRRRSSGERSGAESDTSTAKEVPAPRAKKAAKAAQPAKSRSSAAQGRGRSAAGEPTNEPLDLVSFVSTYEVGGHVEGVVESFTSHGAMIAVPLDGDRQFLCYVRTERLGEPPPTRARDVLAKGATVRFTVVAIDPARRVAELELA